MSRRCRDGLNMLTNYHFHSICSFDGEYPLTRMCRAAVEAGVERLCLTDHCDLVDEYGKPYDGFSWADVDRQLELARAEFPNLELRRGVELGQAVLRPDAAERILSKPDIDFVLGSMHNDPERGDFYYLHVTDKAQGQALLETYFQSLLELAGTDYFDSLAHLTYPLRYMRDRDGVDVSVMPCSDLVREILKTLIHRGKALELNTSGYRNPSREPLPNGEILSWYRELGGELITIGSDAHAPQYMAQGLEAGMELLRSTGFRYLTLYQNRKPQQILL